MEVITNNYQKDIFPLIHKCECCGSTLKIDSEDVKFRLVMGLAFRKG